MKNLLFVLASMVILGASCSKESPWNPGQDIDQFSGNSAIRTCGTQIKVYPGPNDTQTLIDAFALAKTVGKNSVVKLMPGTFKIGMIEVREFCGTLAGSGKSKTILTNLPEVTPYDAVNLNKLPALITFIGGDVAVSDLSVIMYEALPWMRDFEMNMLLFSDYSGDFIPLKRHIGVKLDKIEVISMQHFDTYYFFNGVKFAPDMLAPAAGMLIPRSNIDATVTNSKFSKFYVGLLVNGCKKGNITIGECGGNIFNGNTGGVFVQENLGVTVKIMKNEFNNSSYSNNGIDLNAYERTIYEFSPSRVGTFEIRDNIFNIVTGTYGFGLYDNWRYDHPDNPEWMKMIWEHNTFNALSDGARMGWVFGLKDAVFSKNKVIGNAQGGFLGIYGSWSSPGDPNYSLLWTESCKFLNNLFLQKNFIIELNPTTRDCLIMGDLSNVTVNDAGINNKVIQKQQNHN